MFTFDIILFIITQPSKECYHEIHPISWAGKFQKIPSKWNILTSYIHPNQDPQDMWYCDKHLGGGELKKEIFNEFCLTSLGHRFLVNVVKLKPELPDAELRSLLTDFTNVVVKCCQAEGPEACFNEEVVLFLFHWNSAGIRGQIK